MFVLEKTTSIESTTILITNQPLLYYYEYQLGAELRELFFNSPRDGWR
jgi:hypothetical protein